MGSPLFVTAWLGYAYGASGDRARAKAQFEELKKRAIRGYIPAYNQALLYVGIGDHRRALDCLERAFAADNHWPGWLKMDRVFDPLRSQPRFKALLKKLNFAT
jgi:tetratricopeptide (TPR) repeat protein